ncbi:MAG: nitrous oxide reductase family maturation protein NosD [Acidimicrobiia bacterium]
MRALPIIAAVAIAMTLGTAPSVAASSELSLQPLIDAAAPGSTLMLEPGIYEGSVVVDKPITITSAGDAIIDGNNTGSVITVTAPDVTIENLIIRNSGDSLDREDSGVTSLDVPRVSVVDNTLENVLFGVFLRTAPDSLVSGNTIGSKAVDTARKGDGIRLWECEGTVVDNNTVNGGRDLVFWFTDRIVVTNNTVTNGRYGLHFMYSDDARIEGNNLSDNSVGAFLMYSRRTHIAGNLMANNSGPSGYGIGLKDMDNVLIENNRLIANRAGIYFDNSPWSVDANGRVEGNLLAYNRTGLLFHPSVSRNEMTMNTFIDNTEQVGVTGTGNFTGNDWSVDGMGNYWSDFAGFDAEADGVGDIPYRGQDLYNSITDDHPELVFFQETPAAKAISLAATMFPVLRPKPLFQDDHPLVDRPPLAPISISAPGSTGRALVAVSILMLAVGAVAVAFPSRRRRTVTIGSARR